MPSFNLKSEYEPTGDQPQAIDDLCKALESGQEHLTFLGVTGSGKTFSIANVIQKMGVSALILAPNKTLAGQLYSEFKDLFPDNAVGYFVSYYDYYQPEAYVVTSDTYIAKDSAINDQIDRLRHAATHNLLTRDDVIIVASVSCIYGIGSPDAYADMSVSIGTDENLDRDELLRRLITMQYVRNDFAPKRGSFRARGDVVEIFPAYAEDRVIRVELFGDEVERMSEVDVLTGEVVSEPKKVIIHPASHYVKPKDTMKAALEAIDAEKEARVEFYQKKGFLVEAQRIEQRTNLDLELLTELGHCSGIENYSRHLDGRQAGDPPATLLDYFPKDFILFIDESHVALPQVGGMYKGDRARKMNLVDHGFRLPSALDNRPLQIEEFRKRIGRVVYVSATPGDVEQEASNGVTAEQIIRPTGLLDPDVEIVPATGQVDHLLGEVRTEVAKGGRVLVTSLTKKMAENLAEYFRDLDVNCRYLHSDIDTLERHAILRSLRLGEFDVLVGINLLREGIDIPEVTLVAILDADKEGFLRSKRSLIQTIGRAARNVDGRVILYADRETDSIKAALDETNRRRQIQAEHNEAHGITPQTIKKKISDLLQTVFDSDYVTVDLDAAGGGIESKKDRAKLPKVIAEIRERMIGMANDLKFEEAADLRDQIHRLEKIYLETS
ncbi:MAG: excinuclease ABC subunit B [Planctomycetota bacterium]|jgi:excinuclease ABC subunit B